MGTVITLAALNLKLIWHRYYTLQTCHFQDISAPHDHVILGVP